MKYEIDPNTDKLYEVQRYIVEGNKQDIITIKVGEENNRGGDVNATPPPSVKPNLTLNLGNK